MDGCSVRNAPVKMQMSAVSVSIAAGPAHLRDRKSLFCTLYFRERRSLASHSLDSIREMTYPSKLQKQLTFDIPCWNGQQQLYRHMCIFIQSLLANTKRLRTGMLLRFFCVLTKCLVLNYVNKS